MRRNGIVLILALICAMTSLGQTKVVFNKTEYDFGEIAPSFVAFEHDFLFRNTGSEPASILSVRSVSDHVSFIHTRSEVLPSEYGFVKTKLVTEELDGLFHDEVYVTIKIGDEVRSEVIYIRANVSASANASNGRQFQDGEMAVSVEVSPSDIQTMEGFMGTDELTQAEAEIEHLKKQVSLKSELIAKLSEDLMNRQAQEQENIDQLATLESNLRSTNNVDSNVMNIIDELSTQLISIQKSDSLLRLDIIQQEETYARLKHESDSARSYALDLSKKLQEQFEVQAASMEKTQKLQADLDEKQRIEKQQQAQIDSLEKKIELAIAEANDDSELEALRAELASKQQEQALQKSQSEFQQKKIALLKKEKDALELRTDSLAKNLANQSDENQELKQQLNATSNRISFFEARIDSLNALATENVSKQDQEAVDSLKLILADLEIKDENLKASMAEKDSELAELEIQKSKTQKDLHALELATSRQLEETHNLMHRVNNLSKKESDARMEISRLQDDLKNSKQRESIARNSLNSLNDQIAEKERSISSMTDSLSSRESQLNDMRGRQKETEALLVNAKMSNKIAFEELNAGVVAMRTERDSLRKVLASAKIEIANLSNKLDQARFESRNSSLVIEELTSAVDHQDNVYFTVNLVTSAKPLTDLPNTKGHSVNIHQHGGKYLYSAGVFMSLKDAVSAKAVFQKGGYPKANIIAYKNGLRVSMKEALETASVD